MPHANPVSEVAGELAALLRSEGLMIAQGLRETGLFDRVDALHKAGLSWEQIGRMIGWSPINLRECYVLEGGEE